MSIAEEPMLQFFTYQHLKPDLQVVSQYFCDLAYKIVETLPRNPERTVALRKLLEAKDAGVRSYLYKAEQEPIAGPIEFAPSVLERDAQIEDAGGNGGAISSNEEAPSPHLEEQKKRGDYPRDDKPETFQPGSMVALNNPNPPLRIEVAGRHHGNVQQGEMGQVTRMDEDGMAVVVWRSLPALQVMVPTDWLVAAIETDGGAVPISEDAEVREAQEAAAGADQPEAIFPQPYVKQTTADYSEYAKGWLSRAAAKKLPADSVQTRWEKERSIRNSLASPFGLEEWQNLRKVFTDTVAQLG